MSFICPVCAQKLIEGEKSYTCANHHLFDKAKKGYVNLLLGRDGSQHGDSRQMALARFEIMESGVYAPLKEQIIACLKEVLHAPRQIADCGCGECYYTCAVKETFPQAEVLATDISKEALALTNRRSGTVRRAVASSFSLPIADESCDAALNIFSPFAEAEYYRILKKGGILLMVIPLQKHLWELKTAVYDAPYLNEPKNSIPNGYSLLGERECTYRKTLKNAPLKQLFEMTPYSLKTAREDKQKLEAIEQLEVQFAFKILIYKKEC